MEQELTHQVIFLKKYHPSKALLLELAQTYAHDLMRQDAVGRTKIHRYQVHLSPKRNVNTFYVRHVGKWRIEIPGLQFKVNCEIVDPDRDINLKDYFYLEPTHMEELITTFCRDFIAAQDVGHFGDHKHQWQSSEWKARGMKYLACLEAALDHEQQTFLSVRVASKRAAVQLARELHQRPDVLVVRSRPQCDERRCPDSALGPDGKVSEEDLTAMKVAAAQEYAEGPNGNFVFQKQSYIAHVNELAPCNEYGRYHV